MEKHQGRIYFKVEKLIEMVAEPHELYFMDVREFIDNLSDEACRSLLSGNWDSLNFWPYSLEIIVKDALNLYDPFDDVPGYEGPENEYEEETKVIVKQLCSTMNIEEIQTLIRQVFIAELDAKLPVEAYTWVAEEIYEGLAQLSELDFGPLEMNK